MSALDKGALLQRLTLQERGEPSEVFGAVFQLRELTRKQYRACLAAASLPDGKIDIDRWHAGLFAAGCVNVDLTLDEMLEWPQRPELWNEIARFAQCVLDLSEVGSEAVKSGGAAADAG